MKTIKRKAVKLFYSFLKRILPEKYYDDMYISDFLKDRRLKKIELRKKIWCFKRGFLPYEYVWYDLEHNDYRRYIPIRNSYQKRMINGIFNSILGNKLIFEKHLKSVITGIDKMHVVESLGYLDEGCLNSLHEGIRFNEFSSLIPFLEKSDIILKPVVSDGGVGVMIVKKEVGHFLYNNVKMNWDEMVDSMKKLKGYLIQEKLIQRGFSNEIYSGSVNTMRIGTMIDPETNIPFIAYAVHRFGSHESGFMDNVNQGGLAVLIDIETGVLSEGRRFSDNGEKFTYKVHPVSSNAIVNRAVPGWQDIKQRIIEMARRMPYLKYVGWDIILSVDELFILEGNVSPGISMVQTFRPMIDFPKAWEFFKYHKYI